MHAARSRYAPVCYLDACCKGADMNSKFSQRITMCLLPAIAAFFPTSGLAQGQQSFQCSLGEYTRRVEIVSEPGVSVPCEVHYYKDTEMPGEQQVLWRALNEEGYCESKAREFIASLGEMGWDCRAGSERSAQFRDADIELDDGGADVADNTAEDAADNAADDMSDEDQADSTDVMDNTDDLAPAEDPR